MPQTRWKRFKWLFSKAFCTSDTGIGEVNPTGPTLALHPPKYFSFSPCHDFKSAGQKRTQGVLGDRYGYLGGWSAPRRTKAGQIV